MTPTAGVRGHGVWGVAPMAVDAPVHRRAAWLGPGCGAR
jgi:hypothetical protein